MSRCPIVIFSTVDSLNLWSQPVAKQMRAEIHWFQESKAVILYICIRLILCSNLNWVTGIRGCGILWFSRYVKIGHDRLMLIYYQFDIHLTSSNLMRSCVHSGVKTASLNNLSRDLCPYGVTVLEHNNNINIQFLPLAFEEKV